MQVCCCAKNQMVYGCTTGRRTQYLSTLRRSIRPEPVQPAPRALCSCTKCRQVLPSASSITNDPCYTSSSNRSATTCLNLLPPPIATTSTGKWPLTLVSSTRRNTATAHSIPTPCESVSPKDGDLNILDSSSPLVPAGSKSSWHRPDD